MPGFPTKSGTGVAWGDIGSREVFAQIAIIINSWCSTSLANRFFEIKIKKNAPIDRGKLKKRPGTAARGVSGLKL